LLPFRKTSPFRPFSSAGGSQMGGMVGGERYQVPRLERTRPANRIRITPNDHQTTFPGIEPFNPLSIDASAPNTMTPYAKLPNRRTARFSAPTCHSPAVWPPPAKNPQRDPPVVGMAVGTHCNRSTPNRRQSPGITSRLRSTMRSIPDRERAPGNTSNRERGSAPAQRSSESMRMGRRVPNVMHCFTIRT
jgi:hypothetical protein